MIELMLAALLVPLIAFAIYANFNSGVKIWRRLHQQTSTEDLMIFSHKVSRNFESLFKYTPIAFEGNEENISFAALIETDVLLGGDRGIGQIRLFYDPGSNTIKREIKNLNQIYRERDSKIETILGGVSHFKATYLVENKKEKTFEWLEEWADRPKELPLAVRFEFTWLNASGQRQVRKTFEIPSGGPDGEKNAPL